MGDVDATTEWACGMVASVRDNMCRADQSHTAPQRVAVPYPAPYPRAWRSYIGRQADQVGSTDAGGVHDVNGTYS